MNEQCELKRVKTSIGDLVEKFIVHRFHSGKARFVMRDLHDYILAHTAIAPASPDRILRQLRREGKFDYRVLDRRASCYQITGVGSDSDKDTLPKTIRPSSERKTVTLLHRGKAVDHFPAHGKRFKLPAHVIDHLFASNDFELFID